MNAPAPAPPVCPRCGAPCEANQAVCRACAAAPNSQPRAPSQFSLATLMLVVTELAICLAALNLSRPLGIWLLALSVPALVRTAAWTSVERRQGRSPDLGDKAVKFIASMSLVLIVILSSLAAFGATCAVGTIGILIIIGLSGGDPLSSSADGAMVVGGLLGFAAGLALFVYVMFRTWPRVEPAAKPDS